MCAVFILMYEYFLNKCTKITININKAAFKQFVFAFPVQEVLMGKNGIVFLVHSVTK